MSTSNRTLSSLLVAGLASSLMAATTPTCSGAELFSNESVRYGKWEFRMMAGAKSGTVSSFFTYYNDSYVGGTEPWREIDIEVLGQNPEAFQSNLITGKLTAKKTSEQVHSTANLSTGYHNFVLEWTPDSIVWRVDGEKVRKTATGTQVTDLRDQDQSYRMNLWASSDPAWVGDFSLASLPVYQVVNWMAYSAYTPGKGVNGSNFTETWVDDFTKFDAGRWAKGNWGFDGNLATFNTKNLVAVDGYLVLALTRIGEEGVKGTFMKDPLGNTRVTSGVLGSDRKSPMKLSALATTQGLAISRAGASSSESIRVMDASGRVVAQAGFAAGQNLAAVPTASTGVFLVRSGDQTVTVVR